MVEIMMGNESHILTFDNYTFCLIVVNTAKTILWVCFTILWDFDGKVDLYELIGKGSMGLFLLFLLK
jgi:hypothetical protein